MPLQSLSLLPHLLTAITIDRTSLQYRKQHRLHGPSSETLLLQSEFVLSTTAFWPPQSSHFIFQSYLEDQWQFVHFENFTVPPEILSVIVPIKCTMFHHQNLSFTDLTLFIEKPDCFRLMTATIKLSFVRNPVTIIVNWFALRIF